MTSSDRNKSRESSLHRPRTIIRLSREVEIYCLERTITPKDLKFFTCCSYWHAEASRSELISKNESHNLLCLQLKNDKNRRLWVQFPSCLKFFILNYLRHTINSWILKYVLKSFIFCLLQLFLLSYK